MRTDELERRLGERLRALRIQGDLTQAELAEAANVSLGALKRLERGMGSTTTTLVSVLHALGQERWVDTLGPAPSRFNPLDVLEARHKRRGDLVGCSAGAPSTVGCLMTYQPTDVIEVLAWGDRVGAVALDPDTGWYAFAYTRPNGSTLASSSLRCTCRYGPSPTSFPTSGRKPSTGCPPCWPTRSPTRSATRSSTRGWRSRASPPNGSPRSTGSPTRPTGPWARSSSGRPPRAPGTDATTAVQLADLVLAARRTVRGEFSGDETAHAALEQLIQVGTSAGGARAKAVVAFNPSTYQVRSAYATPAEGFEQWLIKLDGVSGAAMDGHGDRLGDDRALRAGRVRL